MANFVLIAMLFVISACGTSEKDVKKGHLHLRLGTTYLKNGLHNKAFSELLKAEQILPNDHLIQNNLGLAFFLKKNYLQAVPHFEKAIKINPNYSEAKNNLARTLIELKKYSEAINYLNQVLNDITYSSPSKALFNRGFAYFEQRNFDLAKSDFTSALQAQSDFCLAQNYYGRSLYELKQYQGASNAFEKALNMCNFKKDEIHYFGALSYYQMGFREKAIARFEEIIKLYPESEFKPKAAEMLKIIKR